MTAAQPATRQGPVLRFGEGLGPFFAPCPVSHFAARRFAPALLALPAPPSSPRAARPDLASGSALYAPSPDRSPVLPLQRHRSSLPQRVGSPFCERHVAAALRAPPPATSSISPLAVIASNAANRPPLASLFGEPSFPSACQSSPSVVDDGPASPDFPVRRVRAPARSFGPVAGLYSAGRGFAPPGSTKPADAVFALRVTIPGAYARQGSLRASLAEQGGTIPSSRRRGSVAPLPSPAALPDALPTRIAARRSASAPPPSPPFGGSPSPTASQQARR